MNTNTVMDSIRIQIPSIMENIRIVESFIDNTKDVYDINDDIYGNIMISVTEAVNNAIKHGNKEVPEKKVTLALSFRENAVSFVIEDQGEGFDFTKLEDPTAPENIDKPGGRGIFLMKHLADEVHFAQEGRTVELIFYFP
jgi:serine/threonine-protein kinase RsbW